MKPVWKHALATAAVLAVGATAAFALFVGSGAYDFAADEPHTAPVALLLQTMRERSIEARAESVAVPDLRDTARIVQGAGNYHAMCVGCHLAPGMAATELSRGLYPAPPNLTREKIDASEAFWVIKHGIKASGMAAWGKSMSDEYVWNMAAFLQELPKLDEAQYRAMVARSGGHQHDHGEGHHDDDHEHLQGGATGAPAAAAAPASGPAVRQATHIHADGTRHVHKEP